LRKISFVYASALLLIALPLLSHAEQHQSIDPLVDTPGRSIGSDFNGDGIHDFIVGAYQNVDGGATGSGAAYIFFGASNISGTKDTGSGPTADVTILGKAVASELLGFSLSSAGDVNGDGIDDILVGARKKRRWRRRE